MAEPHAVVITMSTNWHGKTEEFSNVFCYKNDALAATEQGWRDLATALADKLKTFHGTGVAFKKYQVWGPLSAPVNQRLIVVDGTLSGSGAVTGGTLIGPENVVLASWYMGRNILGMRNRFLRKYFHVGMLPTANQTNAAYGTATIAAADQTFYKGKFNDLKNIVVGSTNNEICAPDGDGLPLGTDAQVNAWVGHRQFRG